MADKNTAVFGIYTSVEHAERAVDTLIAAGFANSSISVLTPDTSSTRDFAHHKDTKAPEGAAAGVTTGGVIGGTLGVLAGVGALAIPGVGPFIAAGPIIVARQSGWQARQSGWQILEGAVFGGFGSDLTR
jgi:uncharacterized protein YqgC (DUF456 family)